MANITQQQKELIDATIERLKGKNPMECSFILSDFLKGMGKRDAKTEAALLKSFLESAEPAEREKYEKLIEIVTKLRD